MTVQTNVKIHNQPLKRSKRSQLKSRKHKKETIIIYKYAATTKNPKQQQQKQEQNWNKTKQKNVPPKKQQQHNNKQTKTKNVGITDIVEGKNTLLASAVRQTQHWPGNIHNMMKCNAVRAYLPRPTTLRMYERLVKGRCEEERYSRRLSELFKKQA